jgi:hypothetical protein
MPNSNSILIFRGQLSCKTKSLKDRSLDLNHKVRHIGHLNDPICSHTNRHLDPKMCPHPGLVMRTATSHVTRFGQWSSSLSEPADDIDNGIDGDDDDISAVF